MSWLARARVGLLTAVAGCTAAPSPTVFQRVLAIRADETVFAYSRISPDGRTLAYASETRVARSAGAMKTLRTITVIDLATGRQLFTEPGIDAFWSNDGARMIYLSKVDGRVAIRHHDTGVIARGVAPQQLGDYYSWGERDGRSLIMTIESNFYYLNGDSAVLPHARVPSCRRIGVGERPLVSRDGRRVTTFVRGKIVVRNVTDCSDVFSTALIGGKADFSWDGRYIAFHAPKDVGAGYDIRVVDLEQRTVRVVTNFSGSSYFPSWTRDGRLSFRYDGDDYRGFLLASNVLAAPALPLPEDAATLSDSRSWTDLFPESAAAAASLSVVLVWAPWSAHSPDALVDLQRADAWFRAQSLDVAVYRATDPGSRPTDVSRMVAANHIRLPELRLAPERFVRTGGANQIPTTLLFRAGRLVDRRLGAQTYDQLRRWVGEYSGGR